MRQLFFRSILILQIFFSSETIFSNPPVMWRTTPPATAVKKNLTNITDAQVVTNTKNGKTPPYQLQINAHNNTIKLTFTLQQAKNLKIERSTKHNFLRVCFNHPKPNLLLNSDFMHNLVNTSKSIKNEQNANLQDWLIGSSLTQINQKPFISLNQQAGASLKEPAYQTLPQLQLLLRFNDAFHQGVHTESSSETDSFTIYLSPISITHNTKPNHMLWEA